jgi:hypothetical protein
MDAEILHVDAIDEHLALLHIVVARDEVDKRRLTAAALSDECHGLTFGDDEVDIFQNITELLRVVVGIGEGDVAETQFDAQSS